MLLLCNVLSIELGASKLSTSSNFTVQLQDQGNSTSRPQDTTGFVIVANDTSSLMNNTTNQKSPSGSLSPESGKSEEGNGAVTPSLSEKTVEGGGNPGNKTTTDSNTNGRNDHNKDGQKGDESDMAHDRVKPEAASAPVPATSTSRETTWQKLANR